MKNATAKEILIVYSPITGCSNVYISSNATYKPQTDHPHARPDGVGPCQIILYQNDTTAPNIPHVALTSRAAIKADTVVSENGTVIMDV